MPTYQYACTDCGEQLEVVQKFTDDALTTCPTCEGRLRKVYSAVGVVFKGSGFYRTDSRAAAASSGSGNGDGSSNGSESKPDTGTKTTQSPSSPKKEPAAASAPSGTASTPAA